MFLRVFVYPLIITCFQMLRKLHTRGGQRERFYHQRQADGYLAASNNVIRPPTSHPYTGYKSKKSQSQIRHKYMPNYSIESDIRPQFQQLKSNNNFLHGDKLPQPFKLQISQIRVLAKPGEKDELKNLLESLAKNINQLWKDRQRLQKDASQHKAKIKQMEERVELLEKINKKMNVQPHRKSIMLKEEMLQQRYQSILLENCRLGQLNSKYEQRIGELESLREERLTPRHTTKETSNRTDTELLRCQNRISYLQIKLSSAQKMENELLLIKEELQKEAADLKNKLIALQEQNQINLDLKNQWRERAIMQKEDGEIHISRQQFLLYSLKKLRENNKNLIEKLLSISNSEEKIQKKDLIKNPNFDYEMDFFKSIPKIYQSGKKERMYSVGQAKKNELGLQMSQISLEADYQTYKKTDPFEISNLRIFRPNFFAFLEESANQDIYSYRDKGGTSVSRIFIQVLRSILTSKANEFMFGTHAEKFTRFPEFIYSWFEKYYFNSQKNCVCSLEPFMQKPISQENFYRDLMNVKLDQSWQIITFREFLLEQLSLEELYFYLMCQGMLYSRGGINLEKQYLGDFSILVEYSAAKAVLDVALNDFQSWNISFLTSKLRERLITKRNKQFIQAGFFLRCLIEYYRIERCNRYRYISKLCNQFKDIENGLRFTSFMSVINKFTQVPMVEKLRIYRNCFSLTKGRITAESIFIICSQQLVFLKFLKMKSFFRLPKIVHRPLKFTSSFSKDFNQILPHSNNEILMLQQSDSYLIDVIKKFYAVTTGEEGVLKRAESIGVFDLSNDISQMLKALDDRNSQISSSVMKCKHFIHYFSTAIDSVRKVSYYNFYELLEQQNKKKTNNFWVQVQETQIAKLFLEEMLAVLNTSQKLNELRTWKNSVYNFRLHHAAKKIQKQVKKKFIEPYMQIYNYFCNQIKEKGENKEPENKPA